jgi:hypothetical protein
MRPYLTKLQRGVSRLATVDQTEVCPLSRGIMSQSLSEPLQPGLRFFRPPIPAQSTASLTVRLPAQLRWQPYRLTTFPACHTTEAGPAFSPVAPRRRNPKFQRVNQPRTFWFEPNSIWLGNSNEVYQQFTYVDHFSQPCSAFPAVGERPRVYLTAPACPKRPGATLLEELHTPPLPVTHVFLGYCWSYSRFTVLAAKLTRPNNDTPSFRSYRCANPLPMAAQELHTSPRPVGGDDAADWAGPDGNQVYTVRSIGRKGRYHASQKKNMGCSPEGPHTQLLEIDPRAFTAVDARNVG